MLLKKNQDDIENNHIEMGNKYRVYVENPPKWNIKHKKYTYNFNNRVTMASIKNF